MTTSGVALVRCPLCGHLHMDAVTRQADHSCVMDGCPCAELPGTAGKIMAGWRPARTRYGLADRLATMNGRTR